MSNITLYGSTTSPFVRRIRILLGDTKYHFEIVANIYDDQTRIKIAKINPLIMIPILVDGENTIYDSRQIYLYWAKKMNIQIDDSVEENNLITVLDSTLSSMVFLFQSKISKIDNKEAMVIKNNQKRVDDCLQYLNEKWANRTESWKYADICLYTFLDWLQFRNLKDLSKYQNLLQFHQNSLQHPFVDSTTPKD